MLKLVGEIFFALLRLGCYINSKKKINLILLRHKCILGKRVKKSAEDIVGRGAELR